LLAESLEEEFFPGAGRPADDHVLPAGDPFQGAQGLLVGAGIEETAGDA
jgi:hypothetical protein